MLSKLLCLNRARPSTALLVSKERPSPQLVVKRVIGGLIPPDQYDWKTNYWPKKFQIMYALRVHWEIIPLFVVTSIAMIGVFFNIAWAFKNKVDVVCTPHNRENISRTMDLRNPTIHKLILINQRYSPWPEMQDVLDKMAAAEKRLKQRAEACANP